MYERIERLFFSVVFAWYNLNLCTSLQSYEFLGGFSSAREELLLKGRFLSVALRASVMWFYRRLENHLGS